MFKFSGSLVTLVLLLVAWAVQDLGNSVARTAGRTYNPLLVYWFQAATALILAALIVWSAFLALKKGAPTLDVVLSLILGVAAFLLPLLGTPAIATMGVGIVPPGEPYYWLFFPGSKTQLVGGIVVMLGLLNLWMLRRTFKKQPY